MNVLISGASGMVGTALSEALIASHHSVLRLTRAQAKPGELFWDPQAGKLDSAALLGIDAVVHLAGENIAGRWTPAKKKAIRDSRALGTKTLCEAIAKLNTPPKTLISASAIGYYGNRGDELLTEQSPPGAGFLPDVCREWEAATAAAQQAGIRTVIARIGIVLSPKGGALAKMLFPFKMALGGVVGSGHQFMSCIALDDIVGAMRFALDHTNLSGPVNLVMPKAVTNREFTKTLGKVLARPTLFPMPAFAARLAFGEMADELLLGSARVAPERLKSAGYTFIYSDLESALRGVLAAPAIKD
jgi:uncharacterized protein (TIGR01777 family)